MTRLISLSIGAATICATIAAAWAIEAAPAETWERFFPRNTHGTNSPSAAPAYPVRVELPPVRAADELWSPSPLEQLVELDAPATIEIPDAPLPLTARDAARAPKSARTGLIDLDFDIATFGRGGTSGDGELRTRKPLVVAGERLGAIELSLGQGSVVSLDRRELATLVADRIPALSEALSRLEGERVTFDTLRTREIGIRYDPLTDAVVIDIRI